MADGNVPISCVVCGCDSFVPYGSRSDGVQVVRCVRCGMGVVDQIPDDLMALYDGEYYGGQAQNKSPTIGYTDYRYTAEHGLAWAANLVKLMRPTGARVLDIGCADGHLLAKLGPGYGLFGIEANEPMGQVAASHGVIILGQDVLDPTLSDTFACSFDVVTAIAVFEHLRDIRAGMLAAMRLLKNDGLLLFEVPLMSTTRDNSTWLTSSLEHIWYPSEQSLRYLVEVELGAELVGTELIISGYASTYIGLVFRQPADGSCIRGIAARVLQPGGQPTTIEEAVARMLLHMVHGATTTHTDIGLLANLSTDEVNPQLLRRFAELWQADLYLSRTACTERNEALVRVGRLSADLEAADSDRVICASELTHSLVTCQARLAALQADLGVRKRTEEIAWTQRMASLAAARETADIACIAAVEAATVRQRAAETALAEIQSGLAWRVASVLRQVAHQHPRAARIARQALRTLWRVLRSAPTDRTDTGRRSRVAADGACIPTVVATAAIIEQIADAPGPSAVTATTAAAIREGPGVGTPLRRSRIDEHLSTSAVTGHHPQLSPTRERSVDWPLVSVVVTSFNYGQYVAAAVDSVLAQTFRDLEVIVVEGGSSDQASRFAVADLRRPRTRVLMHGEAHWTGANRNFGISQARGRYICCLDADDTLAPTYIEKAVFLLERHGYDVVSSALEMVGDEQGRINITEHPDLEALLAGNHVLTSAVFRRSLWEKAGGYRDVDRSTSGYVFEDWAFWVRLAAMGARVRNLPTDPMLRYRVHGRSLSRGKDVAPTSRQLHAIWRMNRDVLGSVTEKIAISRRRAMLRPGTPSAPPAPVVLDRQPTLDRPHTLLLAMPFMILGGAEKLLSAVVAHLVHVGWRVVIITSIEPSVAEGDTTSWFESQTVEIFHLARAFPPDLWEDFLHHIVRSRGVDVLWIAGSEFAYDTLRGLRAAYPRVRVADLLFNIAGHTANNRRRRNLIDLTFVENNEVRDWLLGHGEDAVRIRLIESGVNVDALRPMARSATLMGQIAAQAGELVVGFSGRWSEEKNPVGFVAIARMVDVALPVRFVVTGTGPQRGDIEHAIREAAFPEGKFHLLGEVSEIASVLASLDLLVVPSVLDGRPMVVLEALSLGVPVLASRVGGLPALIREGRTGWLCPSDDLKAFAERIEWAERNRALLRRMRHHAREYAERELNSETMLTSYVDCLTTLLPNDRRSND